MPCKEYEERKCDCTYLCQVSPYEISHVSTNDSFAACKFIATSEGGRGMSAYTKSLDDPNQFPNYVLQKDFRPKATIFYHNRCNPVKLAATENDAAQG